MSKKLNFRIVEGEEDFTDIYEDLKQDFLENNLTQLELLKKYDLSMKKLKNLRKQMEDEGVEFPKVYYGKKPPEDRYIYFNKRDDTYMVQKNIRGRIKRYGSYDTIENARFVRDALVENNWDDKKVKRIMMKRATWMSSKFMKKRFE